MQLSRYCKIYRYPEDRGLLTLFSTLTSSVACVEPEILTAATSGGLTIHERRTLRANGFLVRCADEEEREMLGYVDALNDENSVFNAIVVLNLDCNLACSYCFEGSRKGRHYLSRDTERAFLAFLRSGVLRGKNEIRIVFYGGEPLLSLDAIVRISEETGRIARQKRSKYSFSLITNGTLLTPRVVERLKPLGLQGVSVTLDGPREVHDLFRPFASGKGSFDTILSNLQHVCSLTDIQLGGNYTQSRYRDFPRLLDHLNDTGLTPGRISSVRFDPVISESAEFSKPVFHGGCRTIDEPWLLKAGVFLRREILKRGFRTAAVEPAVCMIELCGHVVVNYDGALYKCPGMIGRKGLDVGTLRSGIGDYGAKLAVGSWKNRKCLACNYLPLCFGGCRYMKLLRDGTVRGIDCRKRFFDASLRSLVRQESVFTDLVSER